jgi:hypothetical protein
MIFKAKDKHPTATGPIAFAPPCGHIKSHLRMLGEEMRLCFVLPFSVFWLYPVTVIENMIMTKMPAELRTALG